MERHYRTLGYLFIIYGAWVILALLMVLLFPGVFRIQTSAWAQPYSILAVVIDMLFGAFYIFSGWALTSRKDWSRTMIIIASILALFSFPLGTALGIYGLWAIFNARSQDEFPRYISGGTTGQQWHG